ncbi:RHS repeat domain-containing protein [Treponema sp. OMZ 803]|uniref:RHS repeat domain-containing protein n=1 Tax=Treponema sp. OMZ 803 TaxID=120682 RepID=UPI0020A3A3DA|nr:RHS repeat-associated core domain-containing protein [Treponema sp. OMZ 803]
MQVRFLKRLSGKTPLKQNSSGEKIGAESAVLHFVFFIVIVNKMQQSAKEGCLLKRSTVPEVFPLTAGIAGSGKTMPFEKRHAGCEEREKINRRRIYDTLRINFFEATKQTACLFSKGDGNMTRKASTTNLPGARGNAYPKAELDYSLDYEYDPAYAHRLVHAGNRYYRYDANGNITAEKDGPFTEDDEFVFTYNYDPDTDVYGTDYGFGLDAPKETEESHPENLFAYRRNYTWNEKNLLTKSSDRSYTVHYRYGEDGQRALKYTEEGRSETLYFNNFYTIHIPVQDKNNPQGLRVHKHIFVGNSRLVTAMTHTDNNGDNAEQREKRYYYHSDHLGSAQFVTDWRGRQYEHIEYTPYGELWIEEVASGLDKLPFRFTGKEMDEETGLYYYGARYLDPKYSRWLSGDPALGDYIPKAPIDDEAKKHNENLPGMGGVFNVVNLHLYHYAGNNPVKYEDPDGAFILMVGLSNTAGGGLGVSNNSGFFVSLPLNGKDASIGTYTISQTGAYIGLGASSGIELTLAPFADEFSDIEGFSLVSGASVSLSGLIGVGGEIGYNPTANSLSEKIQSITIAGSITANVPGGSPGEVHTWTAYTVKVSELNITKTLKEIKQITNDIEKFLKNNDTDGLMNYLKENELIFQGM